MEIHLYEFWKYGATANGTVQQSNLDLAGNNTWAICVPDFRYPKERINISNQRMNQTAPIPSFWTGPATGKRTKTGINIRLQRTYIDKQTIFRSL